MKQGFWKCCLRTPESSPPGLFRLSSRVALFHNNTGLPFHFVDIYTDSTKAMKGNVGALEWTKAAVPNYPSSHCILHHHALQFLFTCLFIGCAGSLQLCTGFLWLWRVRPALWLRCGGTSLWDEAPHCETRHPTVRRGISLWCEASPCEMRCLTVRGGTASLWDEAPHCAAQAGAGCSRWAQQLWCTGMWDLLGPGIKSMSLDVLQGIFLMTGPPWKPLKIFKCQFELRIFNKAGKHTNCIYKSQILNPCLFNILCDEMGHTYTNIQCSLQRKAIMWFFKLPTHCPGHFYLKKNNWLWLWRLRYLEDIFLKTKWAITSRTVGSICCH